MGCGGSTASAGAVEDSPVSYNDGYHGNLARYWPEPREQLHAGGWARTEQMVKDIKTLAWRKKITNVLDICCGEGGTAVHLAATQGWTVTGVDIVPAAIKAANMLAEEVGDVVIVKLSVEQDENGEDCVKVSLSYENLVSSGRIKFTAANAAAMSFLEEGSFDVVYGQDPDGLASADRMAIFTEVGRVLKPGGIFCFFHHWVPGPNWPQIWTNHYNEDPITRGGEGARIYYEGYMSDLQDAGFEVAVADDCTGLARSHLYGVAHIMRNLQKGRIVDPWLKATLGYLERGLPFGINVVAYKPMNPYN